MTEHKSNPNGWGGDELSAYIDMVRNNQFASYQKLSNEYGRLADIDACFVTISKQLLNPKDILTPLFLARSHGAYRAACAAALSGQSPETFVLLRSSVEAAGYGLLVCQTPELGETWLERAGNKGAVRTAFTVKAVRHAIEKVDTKLAGIFDMLYERAIDFGGHPNEMAMTGSMSIIEEEDRKTFVIKYLDDNPQALANAIKSTAQTGLCSLFIFQHIFPERFELLGLKQQLQALRTGL
jgi:hypothetical protein